MRTRRASALAMGTLAVSLTIGCSSGANGTTTEVALLGDYEAQAVLPASGGITEISFYDASNYSLWQTSGTAPDAAASSEYGTYVLDASSGTLTLTPADGTPSRTLPFTAGAMSGVTTPTAWADGLDTIGGGVSLGGGSTSLTGDAGPQDLVTADTVNLLESFTSGASSFKIDDKIRVGYAGGDPDRIVTGHWDDLWTRTNGDAHARICHTYTPWNVASLPASGHSAGAEVRAFFQAYHDRARENACQLLVTFKHWAPAVPASPGQTATRSDKGWDSANNTVTYPNYDDAVPSDLSEYEAAISRFRTTWPDVHVFEAWNEPNNGAGSGDGLGYELPPETAAKYYLSIRRHCKPSEGCLVTAGAVLGKTNATFVTTCSRSDTDGLCDDGTWFDQYKYFIDRESASFGLGDHFRPEYFSFHPWHGQTALSAAQPTWNDGYRTDTSKIADALGGSWGKARLWVTEFGRGSDATAAKDALTYFESVSRLTRWYYFRYQDMDCSDAATTPCEPVLDLRNHD